MPDRLMGIELFVTAVRLGGLSAAARALNMSPAMAAKHLDALEARLGVTLVRRTTRRLVLTETGRRFLDQAEPLLAGLAEAEAEAAARTVEIAGLLRVAAPVTFGTMHIAPLIPAFTAAHAGLAIELGLNDRFVDLMEEGWDVAVRIGRLADSRLIARKLKAITLVVCAAPEYLAARGTPRTLDDLQHHDCLGFTLAPAVGPKSWSFGIDGAIKVPISGTLQANNGEALIAAAMAGQGLVYGPRFIAAPGLTDGRLVPVTLDAPLMDGGAIYAVTHPERRPAARTRAWIDHLATELGRQSH